MVLSLHTLARHTVPYHMASSHGLITWPATHDITVNRDQGGGIVRETMLPHAVS